jgi:DNA-binding transcriptional ArsR family regulator
MVDVYYIESITQVRAIAEPTRWHILDLLVVRPMTGSQLARALHIPRTRAHYHLNILKEVGLVELQHEQLNGGMVEKYYRATARQFRTDHLVDATRVAAGQDGDEIGTGQVVRDLMLAMLELARADILLPNALPGLARAGFNFQDELLLTREQTSALIQGLRDLSRRFLELDHQNHEASLAETYVAAAPGAGALRPLRLTALLTPVTALNFDSQPKSQDADAVDGGVGALTG